MTSRNDVALTKEDKLENFIINSLKIFFETETYNKIEDKNDEIVVCLADGTKALVKTNKFYDFERGE